MARAGSYRASCGFVLKLFGLFCAVASLLALVPCLGLQVNGAGSPHGAWKYALVNGAAEHAVASRPEPPGADTFIPTAAITADYGLEHKHTRVLPDSTMDEKPRNQSLQKPKAVGPVYARVAAGLNQSMHAQSSAALTWDEAMIKGHWNEQSMNDPTCLPGPSVFTAPYPNDLERW